MTCENGYLPTSILSDLILRSNGDSLLNGNGLTDITRDDTVGTSTGIRPTALTSDRLAGLRSLQQAIESGSFDTGSGLADILDGDSSGIFDANGNLIGGGDTIDADRLSRFLDESAVFGEIENFGSNTDLTSPDAVFGREVIVDVTNAVNDFILGGGASTTRDGGDTDGGGTGVNTGDTGNGGFNLSDYPNLEGRLGSVPGLSFTEIGDYLVFSNTDPNDLLNALGNDNVTFDNSSDLQGLLTGLEDYYTNNIGSDIAKGLCSAASSIIQKILGFLVIIDTAKATIQLIKNLFELDLIKLAEQLAARLTLEALIESIKRTVKKIFDKIKARLLRIINKFKDMICTLKGKKQRAMEFLGKSCTDIEEFYNDDNQKRFIDKVEEFISKLASEFERLTFENVILLLQKLCKFISELQALLFGPINQLQSLGNQLAAENKMVSSVSLINTKYAVARGALRLSPEDRAALQEQARVEINASSASIQELIDGATTDYITEKEMTCDEVNALFCLKEEGVPGSFTFSGSILEREEEGKPQNFKFVKPIVYARLMRMAARLEKEFVIIKGFERKKDEDKLGGSENSILASGGAIHIQTGGSFQEQAEIVVSASQEGFVGIGIHNGYIHLDIGPRKLTWVSGYSSGYKEGDDGVTDVSQSAKLARLLERHEEKEFIRKKE